MASHSDKYLCDQRDDQKSIAVYDIQHVHEALSNQSHFVDLGAERCQEPSHDHSVVEEKEALQKMPHVDVVVVEVFENAAAISRKLPIFSNRRMYLHAFDSPAAEPEQHQQDRPDSRGVFAEELHGGVEDEILEKAVMAIMCNFTLQKYFIDHAAR